MENITAPDIEVKSMQNSIDEIQNNPEVIKSTVIMVDQGEMNVTGQQFAQWYLQTFPR